MYKGKKVVVVSPVGREQSMKILFPYILSNKGIVDEHHLWVNTSDENDLKFINDYYESNKDFVVLKEGCTELWEDQKGRSANVKHFYNYCIEKDTFYFKIDDDIIFIENGLFEDLIDFKLENPEYFLLYPLIINNTWCTHYMRENEVLDIQESEICSKLWTFYYDKISDNLRSLSETMSENLDEPRLAKVIPEKALLCPIYWGDTTFAYNLLNLFQEVYREGKIEELKIPNIILNKHESASINVCCWQGSDFKQFGGDVRSSEDESWLTTFYPAYVNKKNVIVGSKIAVHYSYYTQRSELNKTDILSKYYEIIPKV